MGGRHAGSGDPFTAATVPVRREASRAPAVTAAVSARSTLSPNPTVGSPDASSPVLHPPSGPTATTRWDTLGRSPLSWASTTSPGAPNAAQVAEGHAVGHLGQPDAPALGRRLAGHPAQPLDGRLAAGAAPADDAALAEERHDAVDAQLGELLDDPFGALALDRREGHREGRLDAGLEPDRADRRAPASAPSGSSWSPPPHVFRVQRPRPSAAITSSPSRRRSTRPRWCTSSSERTGRPGSSTKTCAAAAARTVMAA